MTRATVIKAFGYLCGAILLGYGVWFLVAPTQALSGTYHALDTLPYVMGGRYFFFGALLIAALGYGDHAVTAFLLAGFAGLGLFDAVLYLGHAPLPHFAVGIVAATIGIYC